MKLREFLEKNVYAEIFQTRVLGLVVGQIDQESEVIQGRRFLADFHRSVEEGEQLWMTVVGLCDLEEHKAWYVLAVDRKPNDVAVEGRHLVQIVAT